MIKLYHSGKYYIYGHIRGGVKRYLVARVYKNFDNVKMITHTTDMYAVEGYKRFGRNIFTDILLLLQSKKYSYMTYSIFRDDIINAFPTAQIKFYYKNHKTKELLEWLGKQ